MGLSNRDQRVVGVAALIVALGAGMTSNVLFLAAFQFRLDWFLEPTRLLGGGASSAELLRWAAALDLIGYYLATAVLAYVLWRQMRASNPLIADLATMAAFGFALAGGAGAAALAMAGPMLMHDYAGAVATEQIVIAAQFTTLIEVVMRGIWQFLNGILIAGWWLGIGLLFRSELRGFARLSLVLSAGAAIGTVLNLLGLDLARDLTLGVVFTLWTAWWIWLLAMFLAASPPPTGAEVGSTAS